MPKRKSISQSDLKHTLTFEDLLGKTVIDKTGKAIGTSHNVLIHPKKLEIMGISIDTGFISKGLLVGSAHIQDVRKHAIFLNARPITLVKGMDVYDSEYVHIGKVRQVEFEENEVVALHIGLLGKKRVEKEKIASMEDAVILNVKKGEL